MNLEKTGELKNILDQIRLKDRRSWILMVPNSIGETAIVCGLAKGFVKKHGYGITLVIREIHNPIANMYPGHFNLVVNAPFELMRDFSNFGFIPPNHFDIDFPFNTWPLQYGDGRLIKINELYMLGHGRGGLNLTDLYRYILRLDWDTPIERPIIHDDVRKKAIQIANHYGVIKGKSVILYPGSNSSIPAPYDFWVTIADLFRKIKGFKIFSNSSGAAILSSNKPIPGCNQLDLPIDLALAVSELAGHMVIGANGLSALAVFSRINCKVNIILPNAFSANPSAGFEEWNPINSSMQIQMPEVFYGQNNFSEWTLPNGESVASFEQVALDIIKDRSSNFRLTPEMIKNFMSHNYLEWANQLIC